MQRVGQGRKSRLGLMPCKCPACLSGYRAAAQIPNMPPASPPPHLPAGASTCCSSGTAAGRPWLPTLGSCCRRQGCSTAAPPGERGCLQPTSSLAAAPCLQACRAFCLLRPACPGCFTAAQGLPAWITRCLGVFSLQGAVLSDREAAVLRGLLIVGQSNFHPIFTPIVGTRC